MRRSIEAVPGAAAALAHGAPVQVIGPAEDADAVACALRGEGVEVSAFASALDALVHFGDARPDVVVVASGVEGAPAAEVVTALLRHGDPLVVALVDAGDAALAGQMVLAGARSVLTRPFTPADLWAALQRPASELRPQAQLRHGPIVLDTDSYAVWIHGQRAADPPGKEFELLHVLLRRSPGVVGNDELRTALWGSEAVGPSDNTIAVHVARLRHRLEGVARIRRLRGRGYALTLD
ncbi:MULTISPECIES: response regulator transcription factor [unclassified Nocardioides]|uniref:response regulator transcription factor n=1 Tax=unclassified Nocardioides TaxID=2615069 RepID=UPI0026661CE1|nr:response regulator transcription factor [Nocardioides sp. Arc9.136]WKN49640.1 response regulator transcription factor [Nocardioides sp. Arc9.136]